ncbi:MAG: PIN domain-containing protein [Thermomicrobia bacterium]|nr:PIN domain-containing protein [Thermomicrobia bacterium]MCA1723164.1 PIN domain-containing protein [Thermomicrobia bacterium]
MATADTRSDVYLDTSLVIAAMLDGLPDSTASAAFCARLVRDNSRVCFSQVLRLEIAEAFRKLASRQQLPESLRQEYHLGDWATRPRVRQRWMAFGLGQFAIFLNAFYQVSEIPFGIQVWHHSVKIMAEYGLGSHDAAHVATALQSGVHLFATADKHLNRVDRLDIRLIRDE